MELPYSRLLVTSLLLLLKMELSINFYSTIPEEGKLPLGNYLIDNGEWKHCHTQDCYAELETTLSKIINFYAY